MSERRRGIGGRPGKGDRELVGTRVRPAKKQRIDDAAKDAGVTRNDWLEQAIDLALEHPEEVGLLQLPPAAQQAINEAARDAKVNRNDWLVSAIVLALKNPAHVAVLVQQQLQLAFDSQEALKETA